MQATDHQIQSTRKWPTVMAVALGWLFSAVDIILLILFQEEIADSDCGRCFCIWINSKRNLNFQLIGTSSRNYLPTTR